MSGAQAREEREAEVKRQADAHAVVQGGADRVAQARAKRDAAEEKRRADKLAAQERERAAAVAVAITRSEARPRIEHHPGAVRIVEIITEAGTTFHVRADDLADAGELNKLDVALCDEAGVRLHEQPGHVTTDARRLVLRLSSIEGAVRWREVAALDVEGRVIPAQPSVAPTHAALAVAGTWSHGHGEDITRYAPLPSDDLSPGEDEDEGQRQDRDVRR